MGNGNGTALVLILTPDGRFDASDIGSILHRQKEGSIELFIVAVGDTVKIDSRLGKTAKMKMIVSEESFSRSGKIFNEIIAAAQNRIFVFISNRVMPTHDHWLTRICAPLLKDGADAAFGRDIPAPGGNYFLAEDMKKHFPLSASGTEMSGFSIDNCAITRDALRRTPFTENLAYDAAAVWIINSKIRPSYCPEATVLRPADCSLREVYMGSLHKGADRRGCGRRITLLETGRNTAAGIMRDLRFCFSLKKPQYMWYPFFYRSAMNFGYYAGQQIKINDK
ncbi:MAG: hypothetical protein IEMM0002_0733 [bacterium]|nr:MAG: hypothetical protein IEMM0002_0733 [bacterium]